MNDQISEIAARLANDAIDETAAEPVDDSPTLIGYLRRWAKKNPSFFMAAAEHTFNCTCAACITYLATSGLEHHDIAGDETAEPVLDPRWVALRAEYVDPTGQPTADQIGTLHRLAEELL